MGHELGVETSTGIVFESRGGCYREVWPAPVVSAAVFIAAGQGTPASMPDLSRVGQEARIFREDSFDATTRIRRGRFYHCGGRIGPTRVRFRDGSDALASLHHFLAYGAPPAARLVALGVEDSLWRVLNAERITTGEWLVTLKARGGAGLLPEVDLDKVPELGRAEVAKAVDHLVDVAHRETPGSIVDAARNTAALLMGVYAAGLEADAGRRREIRHKDLGKVCAHFASHPTLKTQEVAMSTGHILARLHPRNKPNEQQRHDLRSITEDDATFAVSAIGLLLNEFQWTRASP